MTERLGRQRKSGFPVWPLTIARGAGGALPVARLDVGLRSDEMRLQIQRKPGSGGCGTSKALSWSVGSAPAVQGRRQTPSHGRVRSGEPLAVTRGALWYRSACGDVHRQPGYAGSDRNSRRCKRVSRCSTVLSPDGEFCFAGFRHLSRLHVFYNFRK